ncbi:MAG: hypothetical protein JO145_02110 [Acidobacteriaceae bacterium]|nr:hypothetical protein [Acidobacteriaceae bacterium]
MRKCPKWRSRGLLFFVLGTLFWSMQLVAADEVPGSTYSALSDTLVQRAEHEVSRIKVLVDQGTLPQTRLADAEARLADARDEAVLAHTLYGQVRIQDMTPADANAMMAAAQSRVDRQTQIVKDRQQLVDSGILAKAEFSAFQDELDTRKRVLELARNRIRLLEELRQMADTEARLERAGQNGQSGSKAMMIRYDGNGLFDLGDLTAISAEFQKHFHKPLPVSALGQTLVHQSLGLDHRNRVDIALNPDQAEGLWLRQLLEKLHVPYLAFRSAVAGEATAPHIHIGTGSTRLKLAQR